MSSTEKYPAVYTPSFLIFAPAYAMWSDTPTTSVLATWQHLAAGGAVQTHGWGIVVLTVISAIATSCAVGVRLYMRAVVQKKINLEDWLISVAFVSFDSKICLCLPN